jgi:hypothetical protein
VQGAIWRMEMAVAKRIYGAANRGWHGGDAFWSSVLNARAARMHQRCPLPVGEWQRPIVEQLLEEGVATMPVEALTGGADIFARLATQERAVVESQREEIARGRAALASTAPAGAGLYKGYLVRHDPTAHGLMFDAACAQMMLHPELLALVNGALGVYGQMRKLEFWYTLAAPGQQPVYSQLWHRDYEDLKLVKAFVYMASVDEGSGAFAFVRGTHCGPLLDGAPRRMTPKAANRFDDEEMSSWVPRDRWFTAAGPAGTLVLAMTKGFHKGGLAVDMDRRLLTASYLSPWCRDYFLTQPVAGVPADAHPAIRWAASQGRSRKEAVA